MSGGSYDATARRALEEALRTGSPLACPACGEALASHPVEPPAALAYVRHRILVICPHCHRSGSLDVKRPATQAAVGMRGSSSGSVSVHSEQKPILPPGRDP